MAKMGRKSLRDETMQANVINLSWTTICRALRSPKLSLADKRRIALEIVKKTCPQELKHSGVIDGIADRITIIYGDSKKNDKEVPSVPNRVQDVSKQG